MTVKALRTPAELVKYLQTEENNVIHIKTTDSRLVLILTVDTGMGIPCDHKYSEAIQMGVLKSLYLWSQGIPIPVSTVRINTNLLSVVLM